MMGTMPLVHTGMQQSVNPCIHACTQLRFCAAAVRRAAVTVRFAACMRKG